MNNLKELRSIVRNIISERFEGGINKGLFQSVDFGKGARSDRSAFSTTSDKQEKDSLYPFVDSVKDVPTYEKNKKKVDLKIQEKNKNILNDDDFKKMNEEYFKLFKIFLQSKNIPNGLKYFNDNIKNPFFKKNPSLLSISEVKSFYDIN
jgi:hypothetical protein